MKSTRKLIIILCLCSLVLFVGCWRSKVPGLVTAEGTILYNDYPLAWTVISIIPKEQTETSRSASATSDANGQFRLATIGEVGAMPGEYYVKVAKFLPDAGKDTATNWRIAQSSGVKEPTFVEQKMSDPPYISVLPEKLRDARQSGIEITIPPKGDKKLKIKIKDNN
jgi:hypothetical protein